jgi:hypothetical protein
MAAWTAPPDLAPGMFEGLSRLELLVLSVKLRNGSCRARQAALRSRSFPEIWAMIRLGNHLADLGHDVNHVLARR